MLYFSKIRIIVIVVLTIIFVYLTASNFFKFDDNLINKKINLGLDLQGGSYLLLEIDNKPVITQRLQNKLSSLRKYFKDENYKFRNLKIINNETISFELDKCRGHLLQQKKVSYVRLNLTRRTYHLLIRDQYKVFSVCHQWIMFPWLSLSSILVEDRKVLCNLIHVIEFAISLLLKNR